jgi:hypothetical protein
MVRLLLTYSRPWEEISVLSDASLNLTPLHVNLVRVTNEIVKGVYHSPSCFPVSMFVCSRSHAQEHKTAIDLNIGGLEKK